MAQSSSGSMLPSLMEKSLTDGTLGDAINMDELQRLKHQLSEQDAKWRQAYEKVVKENELLRTRGGEAVLATQWRERYESVLREKDDLAEKLKIHTSMEARTGGADGPFGPGKTIEQAYADLRDEYRDYRRRVQQAEQQRQNELEGQGSYPAYNMPDSFSSGNGSGGVLRSMGLGESKIQYVRHMVFQYLSCKDAIVKPHIESALIALFRYNEMERAAIEEQRKVETQDTITSITNFLGSFTG
jgi:hypothetical protein